MAEKETPRSNYNPELNKMLVQILDRDGNKDNIERAFHLIMADADPDTKSSYTGFTILKDVIHLHDLDLVKKFVIEAKCSINVLDSNNRKPIDYAIEFLCHDIVEWFLNNGIDVNEIVSGSHSQKCKRLHVLADRTFRSKVDERNAITIAKLLIAKGANVLEMNENRENPVELAKLRNPYGDFTKFMKEEKHKIGDILHSKANETILELVEENKELKKRCQIWNLNLKKDSKKWRKK